MPENLTDLSANEIISIIENQYNDEQQKAIVPILFRLEHTVQPSSLLDDLIDKKIIQLSSNPYIAYRLRKYFELYNIEKIPDRKNFIFSKVPDLKGLKYGKNASYDDLVDFVAEKYTDIFSKILSDIKIYSFADPYKKNGNMALLYFNRKFNPQANYKYDSKTNQYTLKEDEVTDLLRMHNINFEVDNPAALFAIKINPEISEHSCRMPLWKIFLLIIIWPVGLYYLYKKYAEGKHD